MHAELLKHIDALRDRQALCGEVSLRLHANALWRAGDSANTQGSIADAANTTGCIADAANTTGSIADAILD